MKKNRVLILGGGREGLREAIKHNAIHIDRYTEIDPEEIKNGIQIHVEDKTLALLFISEAEEVWVYPDFADLAPQINVRSRHLSH